MTGREEFFDRWSAVHGGAEIKGIVRWWLSISFQVASLLRRLRVTANSMTVFGVFIALMVVLVLRGGGSEAFFPLLIASLLLVISLAADGLDGSIALLTGDVSRKGAALDAIADRLAESFWAYAFIQIGADYRVVVFAWLMAQTQEYIRARLGGLGISEIGVVTVSERPVRASFLAVALVIALIYAAAGRGEILAITLTTSVTIVAALWLLLQAIALGQLSRFATRSTIGAR